MVRGEMTPGRPAPHSAGKYPWARDRDRVDTLRAARSRNRVRFGSLWTGTRANSIAPRIFREFVGGTAPKAIAKRLNREGIPGPFGGPWSASTIHGNPKRGTGILNNELYVGR